MLPFKYKNFKFGRTWNMLLEIWKRNFDPFLCKFSTSNITITLKLSSRRASIWFLSKFNSLKLSKSLKVFGSRDFILFSSKYNSFNLTRPLKVSLWRDTIWFFCKYIYSKFTIHRNVFLIRHCVIEQVGW